MTTHPSEVHGTDVAKAIGRTEFMLKMDLCGPNEAKDMRALLDEITRLRNDLAEARGALAKIERWDGFPGTGKFWDDGAPVSYAAQFGSNGERDFMREVARACLADLTWEKGHE